MSDPISRLKAALEGRCRIEPELGEGGMATVYLAADVKHELHDSGEANGFLDYVMPYVEGESLRQRLDRERQLPVDEGIRSSGPRTEPSSTTGFGPTKGC